MGLENNAKNETIPSSELPRSFLLAKELEETDDEEFIRSHLGEMFKFMQEDLGVELSTNMSDLYKSMRNEKCLVRAERLSRVLEAVELHKDLHIADEDESHYANAVIPEPEGIRIALSEGQAPGPVRIMVGFGKTIIGFKTENISVEEIDFSESEIRDAAERKYLCRHVSGDLKREDIRYIVMRVPFAFVREEYLTAEEKQKPPTFIFRGVKI